MTEETIFDREALEDAVAPILAMHGLELWGIETAQSGRRSVVRVYIDKPEGATIDDCAKASRDLSVMLDAEDLVHGAYNLEVSTPGIERPLFTDSQMRSHLGESVDVMLDESETGRKKFKGELAGVEEAHVLLRGEDGEHRIPRDRVKWMRIMAPELDKQPKKGRKRAKAPDPKRGGQS